MVLACCVIIHCGAAFEIITFCNSRRSSAIKWFFTAFTAIYDTIGAISGCRGLCIYCLSIIAEYSKLNNCLHACVGWQGTSLWTSMLSTLGAGPANLGGALPTAATCFNMLKLPRYPNYDVLAEKLATSIENDQGFGLA